MRFGSDHFAVLLLDLVEYHCHLGGRDSLSVVPHVIDITNGLRRRVGTLVVGELCRSRIADFEIHTSPRVIVDGQDQLARRKSIRGGMSVVR